MAKKVKKVCQNCKGKGYVYGPGGGGDAPCRCTCPACHGSKFYHEEINEGQT